MTVEEAILAEIKRILEETGGEEVEVTRDSNFIEELGFSSLDVMEVFAFLEDAFDLKIKDRELQSVMTVGQLIQLVEEKMTG